MSGRGKGERNNDPTVQTHPFPLCLFPGGKGLGKGGAKRHRKVLRDNIQGKPMHLAIIRTSAFR